MENFFPPATAAPPLWVKESLMAAGLPVADWFDWAKATAEERVATKGDD